MVDPGAIIAALIASTSLFSIGAAVKAHLHGIALHRAGETPLTLLIIRKDKQP